MHSIIIAEIGENHLGDMAIARMLIKKAAEAGVDYVKFQSYKPENFRPGDPEYEWFNKVSLSDKAHLMLKEYSEECGVKFLSSPFSVERADFLIEKLGLKEVKIASGVMLKLDMLDYINAKAKTIFLSTGMATIAEIKKALSHLKNAPDIYILHCITQYPCADKDVNLRAILDLRKRFPKYKIGYSDHTIGTEACLAAAALGAEAIEKHFTFDKNSTEGTDHVLSADPDELKDMVMRIRKIELQMGNGKKGPAPSELRIRDMIRNRFV